MLYFFLLFTEDNRHTDTLFPQVEVTWHGGIYILSLQAADITIYINHSVHSLCKYIKPITFMIILKSKEKQQDTYKETLSEE